MPLKIIELDLAERVAIQFVIAQSGQGKMGDARNVRTLTKDLHLDEAVETTEEMSSESARLRTELSQAATKGDFPRARELERELRDAEPIWSNYLKRGEASQYTVESGALSWLQEAVTKHDFARVRTAQGQEFTVALDTTLMGIVADIADAIAAALAGDGTVK